LKILSKFQDYYDSALAFGQDESIVFKRFKEESELGKDEKIPFDLPLKCPCNDRWFAGFDKHLPNCYLSNFVIAFCGKLYYGVRLEYSFMSKEGITTSEGTQHFYSKESFDKFLLSKGVKSKEQKKSFVPFWEKKVPLGYLEDQGSEELKEKLIENKVVVASCIEPSALYLGGKIFTLNPRLKDFDFIKMVDPYTAYQELSMYIGGILAPESKPMIQVSDKDRVQQHGFDKWSFRKMPEKM